VGAVYGDLLVYSIATTAIAAVWLQRYRISRMRHTSTEVRPGVGSYSERAVAETQLESSTESPW
jgi:hypothetical protein